MKGTLDERFFAKVHMTSGCWEWVAGKDSGGYGQIGVDRRVKRAHRVAYEAIVGPIPEGLELDHLCRNRACVRPEHLEPVTRYENVRRGNGWAGTNARKTHCPKGHELASHLKEFHRRCLVCKRTETREYMRRRRAASCH